MILTSEREKCLSALEQPVRHQTNSVLDEGQVMVAIRCAHLVEEHAKHDTEEEGHKDHVQL